MDSRFLQYYEQELTHLREMGLEFAQAFPEHAPQLGLNSLTAKQCADPYVERLLEGFAFLAARVQLKIDAEFPQLTHHLFDRVLPQYLAPTPSMAVFELRPDLKEGSLAEGYRVERGERIRSSVVDGTSTRCEFRTAHDVTLWPIELLSAKYASRDVVSLSVPRLPGLQAYLQLRLRCTAGLDFNQLCLDRLPVFIRDPSTAVRLYEQLLFNVISVVGQSANRPAQSAGVRDPAAIRPLGFESNEALLPPSPRSFGGYRYLQEYFAMPERFMFVEFSGLASSMKQCEGNEFDLIVLLNQADRTLETKISKDNFGLHCTPAINLFPKRSDRIHLSDRFHEYHVVPDRSHPLDYEVFDVTHVSGYGSNPVEELPFHPFYRSSSQSVADEGAYFTHQRRERVLSSGGRSAETRTGYAGSEVFVSLVDSNEAPFPSELRQLGIDTLCTNRDLPMKLGVIQQTKYTLESGAPVDAIICLVDPTPPIASRCGLDGDRTWRLVSHLSQNYLSLVDADNGGGASALREMLRLYTNPDDRAAMTQIESLLSVSTTPVTRCVSTGWPMIHARGLEVTLTMDDLMFRGSGSFLLVAVLSEFFSRYVTVNSFVETVVRTDKRGEVCRWKAKIGMRHSM